MVAGPHFQAEPAGLNESRGMLLHVAYPWSVCIAQFPRDEEDQRLNMAYGHILTFIGGTYGILKISQRR